MIDHIKAWWVAHAAILMSVFYFLLPSFQSFISTHPKSTVATVLALVIAALLKKSPLAAPTVVILALLLLPSGLMAQTPAPTPAPPDIPISHVVISATFTGYDSGGKMQAANIDTFGVQLTKSVTVSYEHVQIPSLSQRWELGVAAYSFTFPKIKPLLFDSSNFVGTVSAGAGKLLSASDGNRFAFTFAGSVTYPIASHMGWQIVSYQYLRATGGISGTLNRSYQSASTGPIFYF